MNSWIILVIAGLLEVCWALSLKATHGFTKPIPTAFFVTTLAGSMFLLAVAVKNLPIGTAYAVWVGIGATGAAIASIFLYGETMTFAKAGFLLMLIVGIAGLKFTSAPH